jgi:V/A-type H+-transporting ATPase subunit I
MFLSGLSGYVHSMRLVYVEYFGKFFEGGGIPFQKFRAQEKYFKIR